MEIAARLLRVTIAVAIGCLAVAVTSTNAQIPAPNSKYYKNFDYQFSVTLPKIFKACVDEHTNHGVVVLLDRNTSCRKFGIRVPRISVYANYNVPFEASGPGWLAFVECNYRPLPARIDWLSGAKLGRREAWGCRRHYRNGRIAIMLVTLRRTNGDVSGWIEVGADLETTVDRYARDERVFQSVLRGIWLHPGGPHD